MTDTGRPSVVIGIGNPDCGDDGAGRAVARRLCGALPPGIEILEHDGEATSLLTHLEGVRAACLIDACASGAAAGTVRRFDAGAAPLPAGAFKLSTHGLGLAEAVELARSLGRLPGRCIVYAIEGSSFEPGTPMSPPVAAAIATTSIRVRNEFCNAETGGGAAETCSGVEQPGPSREITEEAKRQW